MVRWINNEASRLALVKGYSHSQIMDRAICNCCELEDTNPSLSYARAPARANIADWPSGQEAARAAHMINVQDVQESSYVLQLRRFIGG